MLLFTDRLQQQAQHQDPSSERIYNYSSVSYTRISIGQCFRQSYIARFCFFLHFQ